MNGLELKMLRKKAGFSQEELAERIGKSKRTIVLWEKSEELSANQLILVQSVFGKSANIAQSEKINQVNEPLPPYHNKNGNGVPYYDIDFTAGFLEVFNTSSSNPDSYISHPFFNGCDYVVRASGQSMAKVLKHGDAIGLIEVNGWQDFLPFGEIYAIVTESGFRMIKIITSGDTEDTFTLISKPTESKKMEFPPQTIKKKLIKAIFKVQATSSLF